VRVRPIHAGSETELVATRMRDTLVEVLGEARGSAMYTHEWLVERVRFHVAIGIVLVAEEDDVIGHAMARVEDGEGHFSTIYVVPSARRRGAASALADAIEAWFVALGVTNVRYYTDDANTKTIELFERRGYAITSRDAGAKMVKLAKSLR
jgi:ribosomal protein S18 acetylase RimI-like enzyme